MKPPRPAPHRYAALRLAPHHTAVLHIAALRPAPHRYAAHRLASLIAPPFNSTLRPAPLLAASRFNAPPLSAVHRITSFRRSAPLNSTLNRKDQP